MISKIVKTIVVAGLMISLGHKVQAQLSLTNSAATSITRTSATINCAVTSDNGVAWTNLFYYGTVNGSTNAARWQFVSTNTSPILGQNPVTVTGLQPATRYYFRSAARDGSGLVWSTNSLNFLTLSSPPTNSPAPQDTSPLLVNSNGVVVSPPTVLTANRPYPVFYLSLGGPWTDFEIKASTNNFQTIMLWFVTSTNNFVADDPDPKVFFIDSSSAEPRAWRVSSNHVSITSQLGDTNAIVRNAVYQPSLLVTSGQGEAAVTNNVQSWMNSGNTNLVWSYIRFDGIGFERDGANRVIWTPIVPVWESQRKAP